MSITDGGDYVTSVVETTECASDVGALFFLDLVEELADIGRYGAHAETIESTVEHVSLYASFVERFGPFTHGTIGVFAVEEVYLLETATIGFDAGKTAHFDYSRSYFDKLVDTGYVFTRRLPHVSEDETKLYLSFHSFILVVLLLYFFNFFYFALTTRDLAYGKFDGT